MDRAVVVERLVKNYTITKKQRGLGGSIASIINPQKARVRALRGISFSVGRGEIVGFIGPNGAGKTTTLKILSGLLYPTSGFTQVLGFDPWERDFKYLKKISLVMGQKNQLWWDLPAIDTFELNKAIYEIEEKKYKKTFDELVALLGVGKLLDVQVRRLSLGQRMRLEFMASLLHSPEILFLDEPTIGLDVVAQQSVRDFIEGYAKKNNATVILTSHNIEDLVNLTKRVIIVDNGEIVYDGDLNELVSKFVHKKIIKATLAKEVDIKKLDLVGRVRRFNFPQVVIEVERETSSLAASELLQNFPITDMNIEEESIEEVVRKIFKGELLKRHTKKK